MGRRAIVVMKDLDVNDQLTFSCVSAKGIEAESAQAREARPSAYLQRIAR